MPAPRNISSTPTSLPVLLAAVALAACGPSTPGGVVQGVVYTDSNGNGVNDPGEGPLAGVAVDLSGCGANAQQMTGPDGAFAFTGLPAGSCLVQVSKAGWGYSGSFPSVGYPIPVASDPNKPTAFSIFMASMMDAIPTETPTPASAANCSNVLETTFEWPLMKTNMAPGQSFTKFWTVQNKGTCAWDNGYHLVFEGGPSPSEGGSSMGAALDIPLGSLISTPVLPGQSVTIALGQTAPSVAGWYVGSWKVVAPNGDVMPTVCLCTDIVVKAGTPLFAPASISGLVWHDLCALPNGPLPPAAPPGCIPSGGSYEANGVLEAGEPGIAGVTVRLGGGACPSSGLMASASGADGSFSFAGLPPGAYCVSVDALADGNDTVLIPGGWTYPVPHANPQLVDLALISGQVVSGVNFGWDYQFLPAWTGATSTPTAASASGFAPPFFSVPIFYYRGGGCGPRNLDLSVQALDPGVRNVVLFFRLKDPASSQATPWNEGVAMIPQGGGAFSASLASESIPDFMTFPEAVLQVQFVAEGAAGIVSRSPVFGDVTLVVCNR